MLDKYRNEIIIVISAALLLVAIIYKSSTYAFYNSESDNVSSKISKIKDIAALKKLWKDKEIPKKLKTIESTVSADKIGKFDIQGRKATIVLNDLTGEELNNVVTKSIATVAVEIVDLSIRRNEDKYKLEVHCKW